LYLNNFSGEIQTVSEASPHKSRENAGLVLSPRPGGAAANLIKKI